LAQIATAVLGCGAMGASSVTAFRAAGRAVRLWDPDAAAAHAVAARHGDGVTVLDCPETAAGGRLCSRKPAGGSCDQARALPAHRRNPGIVFWGMKVPFRTRRAENIIKRVCFLAFLFLSIGVSEAKEAPQTRMWRLDCGEIEVDDLNVYSSRRLYAGQKKTFTVSCYLIKHGHEYMLWDSGLAAEFIKRPGSSSGFSMSLRRTVVDQLGRLNVRPEQITILGISHHHYDHIGQADSFPNARLLIGADDLPGLRAEVPPFAVEPQRLVPWLKNGASMEGVRGDKDVFGDGSVVMIATPGHTPGHHSLLVRLPRTGAVLLTGDLYHFREQLEYGEVPPFNDRAQTLASFERMGALAKQFNARIIIQHEARDIAKLPLFPKAAR
jgi:N-acyl homoserine lactone hydrolase